MSQDRYILPAPLGKLLSCLPAYPGSLLFTAALNLVLVRHLPGDVQRSLEGKKLRIRMMDAPLVFDFVWRNYAFEACRYTGTAEHEHIDLMIGASAHDFLLLAQRKEDPDTLFFSRRLIMEGDTELGLLVKNTLDAIEVPLFDPNRLLPARVLGRLRRVTGQVWNAAD